MKENNLARLQNLEIENQGSQESGAEKTSEQQEEGKKLRERLTELLSKKSEQQEEGKKLRERLTELLSKKQDIEALSKFGLVDNMPKADKINIALSTYGYNPNKMQRRVETLKLDAQDPEVAVKLEEKRISHWIVVLSIDDRQNLQAYLEVHPEKKSEIREQIIKQLLKRTPFSEYAHKVHKFFRKTDIDPLTDKETDQWVNIFLEDNSLNARYAQWFVSRGVSEETEKSIIEYLEEKEVFFKEDILKVIISCSQLDAAYIEGKIATQIDAPYCNVWQKLLDKPCYDKLNILQKLIENQAMPATVCDFFLAFKEEIEKSDPERFKSIKQTVVNNLINSRYQDFSLLDYRIQAITGEEMSEDQIETVLNNLNTITQSTVDFIREHSAKIEDSQIISLADRYLYKAVQGNFKPAYVAELYKIAGQDPKDNEDLLRKMIERLELEKDMP